MIKRILLSTLVVPTALSTAIAQTSLPNEYALQTPFADSSILLSIHQQNNIITSVGEHGIIIEQDANIKHSDQIDSAENKKSQDSAWRQLKVPTNNTLTGITELNDGTLLAVGHEGLIIRKPVNGEWQHVFDGYQLITLKQTSLDKQIAQLQTQLTLITDEDELDEMSMMLEDLEFAKEDFASEIDSGPTSPLLDIKAIDENTVIAVGAYNSLLISEDKGMTWDLISSRIDNPQNFHLNNIVQHQETIFLFGEAGVVYRSKDNGKTFETMYLPYEGTFFGGEVVDDFVVAYGLKGNIAISNDGGDSWEHQQINSTSTLLGSTLDSEGNVWIVGHAGVVVQVSKQQHAIKDFKHPSGDIFTDVIINQDLMTLVGQNGAVQWRVEL